MKQLEDNNMEKVKECYNGSEIYQCERCKNDAPSNGWYCSCCNPPQTIEFEVSETIESINGGDYLMDWKGEDVCPYCFNQLIDLAKEKFRKEVKG